MSTMISVHSIGDSITGSVNGKQFGVRFTKPRWDAMKELEAKALAATTPDELKGIVEQFMPMTIETYGEIVETSTPFIYHDLVRNVYFLKYNDKISSRAIPQGLVDRILKSVEKGIDITPMVKLWVRWLRNPVKPHAARDAQFVQYINTTYMDAKVHRQAVNDGVNDQVAIERATSFQVPITMEGLMCTYKVSKEITTKFGKNEKNEVVTIDRYDFDVDEFTGLKTMKKPQFSEDLVFEPAVMGQRYDAFRCRTLDGSFDYLGHIIKVGCIISLEKWSQVAQDQGTGVPGLHCGNLDYIRSYQNSGTATHDILVDPMHIGGFSGNGDGALVTKEYFVSRYFQGVNKSLYHSSDYAAWTDALFAQSVQEVVAKEQKNAEEVAKLHQERAEQLSGLM